MFLSALQICEAHPEELPKHLADATFCLSSHAADTNQFGLHLELARRHFDQRMKIENQKPALELGAGMAHSEMALGYLLNENYGKAIEHSTISRQINEKTSNFLGGTYWPFFSIIHHAQALQGLNRENEATDMLLETLRWREARFGPNDKESFKYILFESCSVLASAWLTILILRLGYALQVLGAIRAKQGNRVESLELFTRALVNYEATIGLNHHRTGHVLVKLAEEHAYINHPETAEYVYARVPEKSSRLTRSPQYFLRSSSQDLRRPFGLQPGASPNNFQEGRIPQLDRQRKGGEGSVSPR